MTPSSGNTIARLAIVIMIQSHPLTSLKLLGLICPCLESNVTARNAAWSLSAVKVSWRRSTTARTSSSNASSMTDSVKGLFSMFNSSSNVVTATEEDGREGTLSIVDTPIGPSLAIDSEISIPLRHIISIASSNVAIEILSNESTLQIHVLTEDGQLADEIAINQTYVNLQNIHEWERQRQDKLLGDGMAEQDQYPSTINNGNMLTDKAKQIQHFAQREIEMQKSKREREARKAKHVQGAGGLKYTAIAMANRS